MKNLTTFAVSGVMDLLIHTNGQTTTLEVKNQLRDLGYFANQDEVHSIMNSIYENDSDNKYTREVLNSKYNVYSFDEEYLNDNPEYDVAADTNTAQVAGNVSQQPSNKPAFSIKNTQLTAPSILSDGPIVQQLIKQTLDLREPLFIFYTENEADKSGTDSDNWVVSHKSGNNEIHVFDKTLTRDQVRSKYASTMRVKIQDVRARRYANY